MKNNMKLPLKPTDFDSLNLPQTVHDDIRIGELVRESSALNQISVVGFCSDIGVTRNNGRPGAAKSPDLIRSAFYRLTPDPAISDSYSSLLKHTNDDGNIFPERDNLEQAQTALGEYVAGKIGKGILPVVLGGGHETSYGHFLGYVKQDKPVTIINWDAHADVRELKNGKAHSGSPFRQALEHESGLCKRYIVAGLKRQSLSKAHFDYLQTLISGNRGNYYFKGELNKRIIGNIYERARGSIMVTMDMDALSQHLAPGVSAPNPDGIPLPLWLYAAWCAGASPRVSSFDLVEMNPKFDIDGHTARIAALTLWHFFKGFLMRKKTESQAE